MRMNMLSKITFVVTLASLLLAPVKSVAADEFTPIFDGKSFDGWKAADMSFWTIEDDALTAKITKEHPLKQNLYLIWQGGELADFELKMKHRVFGSPKINGGFQFRSWEMPNHDVAGYQMDNNLDTPWLVRLYDEHGRHTLAWRGERTTFDENGKLTKELIADAQGPADFRLEEWHEYHLICVGSHLTLKVNGRLVAETFDNDPQSQDLQGILGLQLHTGPPTTAQFKDIRLKIIKPATPELKARGNTTRAAKKPIAPVPVANTNDATSSQGHDKTLVAWVSLANLTQAGGSALTIQSGDPFDAIVFGERVRATWMAGSDFYRRTQRDQNTNIAETASPDTLVQIAIVYEGDNVRIYRNGESYAAYTAQNIDLLSAANHIAVFGLRHVGAGTGARFAGTIDDARIYGRALTVGEIQSLKPNVASEIKPLAWWDFEGDTAKDRAGHFTHHAVVGGAKLKDGRLVLDGTGSLIEARSEADAKLSKSSVPQSVPTGPYVPETLAWPDPPPPDWMTFHLAHPGPGNAMPGDPNCAFDWKGRVHLHYIYRNPWGFVFGHVSSEDLMHWQWHKTVLAPPTTGHGMFSGTGFLTKEGKPAIIYHGQGSGRNQIAVAEDDQLDTWSKPWKLEPKIRPDQDGSKIANWDPDAWLDGDTYYALSGGNPGSGKPPTLFKSPDLKSWEYLGLFLTHDMPDVLKSEDISCPNFFKIGNKHMLLCISHNLGCRYYLGEWKGEKFAPDFHARMSWNGNNFFAPESVLAKDGRRVMWAWLMGLPIKPTGVQSLPRELSLPDDGVLRIKPLRELETLRYDEKSEQNLAVKNDVPTPVKGHDGNALELQLSIVPGATREFGLDVLCDAQGQNGLRIAYVEESKTLRVGKVNAPFALKEGEDLALRVFIDKNLVEVFANDRQAAVAAQTYVAGNTGINLFSKGGDVVVKEFKRWKMKSTYTK
ncbi:MAG: family 16 glycoside hydrolase [bacterium]